MLSLLIGVVGAAGAWLLGSSGAQSPLIWTTSALAAGATLRWGWRQGALVMLGHVLVNLAHGLDPRLIARGVAYGMLGALTLRGLLDLVGFRRRFEHIRDVGRFVVAAAAAGTYVHWSLWVLLLASPAWALFDREQQAPYDRIAGTRLVHDPLPPKR